MSPIDLLSNVAFVLALVVSAIYAAWLKDYVWSAMAITSLAYPVGKVLLEGEVVHSVTAVCIRNGGLAMYMVTVWAGIAVISIGKMLDAGHRRSRLRTGRVVEWATPLAMAFGLATVVTWLMLVSQPRWATTATVAGMVLALVFGVILSYRMFNRIDSQVEKFKRAKLAADTGQHRTLGELIAA